MLAFHTELLEGEAVDISCRAQAAYPAPGRLTWDRRTAGGEGGQVTENPS
jgi:hypothetical protein